jgi:hypothetical protein
LRIATRWRPPASCGSRVDVPFPVVRRFAASDVAHDDGVGPQVDDRALGLRELAVVGALGVADGVVEAVARLELASSRRRTPCRLSLALAAVEGDGVGRARLLVPLVPVLRAVVVVVARGDGEPRPAW